MIDLRNVFILKNIRASNVNLIMNDYAAGLPSPLSFLGLADLIARNLKLVPWSARVIPVLHRVTVSEGRTKPEMEWKIIKETKLDVFSPVETMEDLKGSVEVSLLIHLPGCDSESLVREQIVGRRIAGGLIQNDQVEVSAAVADGSVFRDFRRGYAMIRPDQSERCFTTSGDLYDDQHGLARIAELLFPIERPPGFGWIVPSAVGYRLLEDPATAPQRTRTRNKEVPHVYAEPVVGIAELVSVRNSKMTALSMSGLHDLFWSWDSRGDLILGHTNYHTHFIPTDSFEEILTND